MVSFWNVLTMNLQGGSDLWSLWRPRHSKGLVAGCHSFCLFFIFITYITFIRSHSFNTFIRRYLPRSLSLSLHSTLSSFISAEWFGTEFREFASFFVQRNGIPSSFLFRGRVQNRIPRAFCSAEITIFYVYSVFRGIIFLSEILNPSYGSLQSLTKKLCTPSKRSRRWWSPSTGTPGKGLQEVQVRYWECRRCWRPFNWKSLFPICSFANLFFFW